MSTIDPLDFFDRGSLLTDDERMVQHNVARFVDAEVLPIIGDCFAEERFPSELVPRLADLGLFGSTLSDYGCAGLNYVSYGLICEELERGDSSVRSCVSVQSSLVMHCIERFGSDEQKSRWLPDLARGVALGCFALTESQGGSDPGLMSTNVVQKRGADWLLNGEKYWITNGALADVAIVWCKAGERVAAFLVERGMAGFEATTIRNKLSLRAS